MTKRDKQNGKLMNFSILTIFIIMSFFFVIYKMIYDMISLGITDDILSINVLVTVFLGSSLCNIFIWEIHKIYEYPKSLPLLGRHWEKFIQGFIGIIQIFAITYIFSLRNIAPKISQITFYIIIGVGAIFIFILLIKDFLFLKKNFRGLKYIGDEEQQDLQSTETHNLHFAVSALKDSEITKLKNELSEKQKELVRTQQQLDEYKNMGAFRLLLHKLF